MELKDYQQEVLNDLSDFMGRIANGERLDDAYREYWAAREISLADVKNDYIHPYDNSVQRVPNVTIKVPTAGGKTFIACNAMRVIFDKLPSEKPKVVAWFVPSDTILKQTLKNLSDPGHPYRQRINTIFGNAVRVLDKESALNGNGISPTEIQSQLTLFVLSVQSFASNTKEGRRVYRENENLASYTRFYDSMTKTVKGSDETGFIQVLSYLNPVVIIDESHNFEADLRVDMLNDINPCFILNLTATPRKKSNIISFVDAIKLKRANMVKLPVVVYNHNSTNEVISSAINLQRSLERKAIENETNSGKYIRPIVLFQAQPNKNESDVTFDKIKEKLVETGIPQDQIKIKTATKDEISSIDLLSRECPVRFIITIDALKEGWDCPFAYILASLANKTSKVSVEQILGRILRLPYTAKHDDELLNMSYVFTSSNNFRETLDGIISSLNRCGFSKKDYRMAEFEPKTEQKHSSIVESIDLFDEINVEQIKEQQESTEQINLTKEIETIAIEKNNDYEQQMTAVEGEISLIPNDLKDMTKTFFINEKYSGIAESLTLPMFQKRIDTASIFESDGEMKLLDKAMLVAGFDLDKADRNVNFTLTDTKAVAVDLEERRKDEYVPIHKNLTHNQLESLRKHIASLPKESLRNQLALSISQKLKYNEILETAITKYVRSLLNDMNTEQLNDLFNNEWNAVNSVKTKIDSLIQDHREQKFSEWIDTEKISCTHEYHLPKQITLSKTVQGLQKGLYEEEIDMNSFEYEVIRDVANLDNVVFWHKNIENRGFYINGFIDHYPDFIVYLNSGKIVLVETKGEHLANQDSMSKIKLGKIWEKEAGKDYRYYMVFKEADIKDALTVKELVDRLKVL